MVAFIGMGLLGSNFVRAMIGKGESVQVWNRTPSKAAALEQYGAKAFPAVADAVRGAETIHITLKDDASVNEVLAQAEPGLKKGATLIDHTTTSAEGAIERTAAWAKKGFTYVHAPVFMGPPNALDSTGTMLVSGDPAVVARVEPALAKMTGKVLNYGPEAGKAASMKLLGNLFLITLTGGLADTLSFAKSTHVSMEEVYKLFETWNPAGMVPTRLKRMTSGDYSSPSWELSMARKDARLMIEAADKGSLTIIPAMAAKMDKYISEGHGNSDWTVIAKDNIPG
ncbi:MAG TPA: NAD(P)-dependent oxidoreductase [Puia sp.]